ncbi:MAG: inorganic phosphate transporter [Betaproteobacteria bacterium]|nr:inorganic phosphate transporter [Betaproteobacteria bacterium]
MTTSNLILVAVPVVALAWANGANDVSKGVATLIGSGVAGPRRAILWGTLWTVLGGLAALALGSALAGTFASGFLVPGFPMSMVFVVGTLSGACAWLLLATRAGWPVSTTHALLGAIVGAALFAAGPAGLKPGALAGKALLPLLASPLLAIALCWLILLATRWLASKVPAWRPGCCAEEQWRRDPFVCAPGGSRPAPLRRRILTALHWASSGATSFARGLNDVPKIAALLIAAAAPAAAGPAPPQSFALAIVAVTLVMGVGSIWGGLRVARVLAHRVAALDSERGLIANLGTSLLVLAASPLGLPVSTTHVSTGALMGIRWAEHRLPGQGDALRAILLAWCVTLPACAAFAAAASALFQLL